MIRYSQIQYLPDHHPLVKAFNAQEEHTQSVMEHISETVTCDIDDDEDGNAFDHIKWFK
jgi:hypothetical protein